MHKLMAAALAAMGLLGAWAAIENTALLEVTEYEVGIPNMPRTVQISDLHRRRFRKDNAALIRTVADLRPELIVITGDLVSRTVTELSGTARLLRRLRAIAPVIMIYGNHELDLKPSVQAEMQEMIHRSGAILLDNKTMTFRGVRFAGITLTRSHYRGGGLFGFRGARTCTIETMQQALGDCAEDTVLLAHNPLFFPAYAHWGAALTLSGHVHGGALRLPLIGGLLSPERRFFPRYDKGLYRLREAEMIVSAGLGKLRLFNPPELCLITPCKEET